MVDKDELLEHNYDGIQEYDNDLPRWWVAIFGITAVYAIGYIAWVHFLAPETQHEQLARQISELEAQQQAVASAQAPASGDVETVLLALTTNQESLARGKETFIAKCAVCHGQKGEGLIGPNLTDKYWVHGGSLADMQRIVMEGVVEKGMLAWKTMMSQKEIDEVVAYIWTLEGTNPPNQKAQEGQLYERSS